MRTSTPLDEILWKQYQSQSPRPVPAKLHAPRNYVELAALIDFDAEEEDLCNPSKAAAWSSFLHAFFYYKSASFFEERPPDMMPVSDLQLVPQNWFEVDPVNRTRPVRLPPLRRRTGEYPILRLVISATCAPCEQNLRHLGTDGNRLSRSFRLAAFNPLLDHIANHAKLKALEIDISPLQAEQLADSESCSSSKRHSRSRKIIDQPLQKEPDLFRRKDRWNSGTLRTLTDMTDRVGDYGANGQGSACVPGQPCPTAYAGGGHGDHHQRGNRRNHGLRESHQVGYRSSFASRVKGQSPILITGSNCLL